MGRIHTFVFNSQIASVTANLTSQELFFVDWSVMKDCPYKVSFIFSSATPAIQLDNNSGANIFMDLGQGALVTVVSGQNSSATFGASFLGVVVPTTLILGTAAVPIYSSYLSATTTTNNPIYILGRPRNNNVQIQIREGITTADIDGIPYDPYSGAYTMVVNFEEV